MAIGISILDTDRRVDIREASAIAPEQGADLFAAREAAYAP
jgi:hypothetical protein